MFDLTGANLAFVEGDTARAAQLYLEGAREGNAMAAANYAYCLRYGIGVTQDGAKAKSFYSFAKESDDGECYYNLAVMYIHGEGVRVNYKTAFSCMRASAARGCLEAQLYLGMLYTTGAMFNPDVVGVHKIPTRTTVYRTADTFLLSGDIPDLEADEEARFSVTPADAREAFLYFRDAARNKIGSADEIVAKAQYLYAKCFLDGLGTEIDQKKGGRIMLLSAKSGSQEALGYLIENNLTPQMLLGDKP